MSTSAPGTTTPQFEVMLTTQDVAELLALSPGTLENWRAASRGPDYYRLEGTVRYRMSDVAVWLEARKVPTIEGLESRRPQRI